VITAAITALLFFLIIVLPQSFAEIKLPFLGYLSLVSVYLAYMGNLKLRSHYALLFYVAFSVPILFWSLTGALRGNATQAIVEAIMVYVVYMWAYALLVLLLSNSDYQRNLVRFFSCAAVGIAFFAYILLVEVVFSVGILPEAIKETMFLQIALHAGFVEMNNINMGMYCFVLPFLVSAIILKDPSVTRWTYFCAGISLFALLLASRRMVFIVVAMSPFIALVVAMLIGEPIRRIGRRVAACYGLAILAAMLALIGLYRFDVVIFDGLMTRMAEVFVFDISNPSSERRVQHAALMEAFMREPLMGSGFGGVTDVVRSFERPWTYEMTYSKVIFNSGLAGVLYMGGLFLGFLYLVIGKLRRTVRNRPIYASMLVGFLSVAMAAGSNPYLSSFDFVFVLSIIPLILNSVDSEAQSGGLHALPA
jgi:hypothetical protein